MGIFIQGDKHTALQHVLQQPYRLEADRLAAGVRARNNQQPLLFIQGNIQRYNLPALLPVRQVEQRVDGVKPVRFRLLFQSRHQPVNILGKQRLGADKIYLGKESIGMENVGDERADGVGESRQDADNLALFLAFQLADAVVCFYDHFRLDKDGLAGSRLVMHNALYLALVGGGNGNHEPPVAHGRRDVLVHQALRLRTAQNGLEAAGDAVHRAAHFPPDARQFGGGIVLEPSELVEDSLYLANQLGEGYHIACQSRQMRVGRRFPLLRRTEEADDRLNGLQGAFEVEQLALVHPCALRTYPLQGKAHVKEIIGGKLRIAVQDANKLNRLLQKDAHRFIIGGERHVCHALLAKGTQTFIRRQAADGVESCLLLKIQGVYHLITDVTQMP
ncbi:hypothetical protein Barb6_03342 [Bacteroidales bacterium Barb6]|nr:hypothetical protein Barb6_03342 [Bacteroidales bacterium Barb6]